jgi:hypothetical protein
MSDFEDYLYENQAEEQNDEPTEPAEPTTAERPKKTTKKGKTEKKNLLDFQIDEKEIMKYNINVSDVTFEELITIKYYKADLTFFLCKARGCVGFVGARWFIKENREGQPVMVEKTDEKLKLYTKNYKPFPEFRAQPVSNFITFFTIIQLQERSNDERTRRWKD